MQSVEITHKVGEPLYCPFCGKETIASEKPFEEDVNACEHLLYLGVNEGDLSYAKPTIIDSIKEYEESGDEDDLINIDIEEAIHFSLCAPAPSSFGVFVAFKK